MMVSDLLLLDSYHHHTNEIIILLLYKLRKEIMNGTGEVVELHLIFKTRWQLINRMSWW